MKTTRREFIQLGAAVAITATPIAHATVEAPAEHLNLWYRKPADQWRAALPVGNGRLGAMIYGGTPVETIELTESTIWSGAPCDTNDNPSAPEYLSKIRELMFQGRYIEARHLCGEHLLGRKASFGTNLPMAQLRLTFEENNDIAQYRRSLDLDEGVAHVKYTANGACFSREIIASNPDDALVIRLSCDKARKIAFRASLQSIISSCQTAATDRYTLVLRGHAWENMHSDGTQGVEFESYVRILPEAGTITSVGDQLWVQNADAVTILVAAASNYQGGVPASICKQVLDKASTKPYVQLRNTHVDDYQRLYRRVQISLGLQTEADSLPTDERRQHLQTRANDPGLYALFFQFGRYLTIAGSRVNSPLPLALQGIWNDGLASTMPWTDDYHMDINTEQNYWLAEVANLSECQEPLFRLVESMQKHGHRTAEKTYQVPGWVSHVFTNAWGYTAPGWGLGWGLFVTGGVWISSQMWEHYRFTNDTKFLRDRAYPVLKDAAEFFLAYMTEHPKYGWLVTGPSVSPENSFLTPQGLPCSESMGPTCDRVLVYALFSSCIEASKILGADPDLRRTLESARGKLAPLQVGKYGQLQEWLEDFEEAEPNHRHTSHLLALYPYDQISVSATPALAKAALVTMKRRESQPNWEGTEWTRANFINFQARLLNGDAAHDSLAGLLTKGTFDNLMTYAIPGIAGGQHDICEIDANCAGAAGIAEMLLQSQGDDIHLLPALPSGWKTGFVKGLCARGGIQVTVRWTENKLQSATLSSKTEKTCSVRYQNNIVHVDIRPNRPTDISFNMFRPI